MYIILTNLIFLLQLFLQIYFNSTFFWCHNIYNISCIILLNWWKFYDDQYIPIVKLITLMSLCTHVCYLYTTKDLINMYFFFIIFFLLFWMLIWSTSLFVTPVCHKVCAFARPLFEVFMYYLQENKAFFLLSCLPQFF